MSRTFRTRNELAWLHLKGSAWLRLAFFAMLVCAVGRTEASAQVADPIVTRDHVFYIPFTAESGQQPELVLYVSGDQGKSWQRYQTQAATAGRFSFRAGVDGEFWFAVRRADEFQAPSEAELVVAVDRVQPQMTLNTFRLADGRLLCEWSCEDDHLDENGIALEFQMAGKSTSTWTSAIAVGAAEYAQPKSLSGKFLIPSPIGSQTVKVRATAKDRAGNTSFVERDFDPTALAISYFEPPVDASRRLEELFKSQIASQGGVPPSGPQLPASPAPSTPAIEQDRMDGWTVNHPDTGFQALKPQPQPLVADPVTPPAAAATQPMRPPSTAPAIPPVVPESRPNVASLGPHTPSTTAAQMPAPTAVPETPPPPASFERVSKSKRFEIDYGVAQLSVEEIHRIEIWLTDDGGQTWRHHGDDEDRQSPYLVEVTDDGLYGVRMLIQTKIGYTQPAPRSGDPADIWIRVDATPPTARLTSVRYGNQGDVLEIYWNAEDKRLAERPITLYYSDNLLSGWRKMAGPLPNTGRFNWPVDQRAPQQIYLRIEARDTAGNVTVESLSTPIQNQRAVPRGTIRDVRPASATVQYLH